MSDLVERLTRAGGAMANLCYNLKQQTFGTERIRLQMDEAQSEWDAALAEFPAVTAELSRLTREVEALRDAAEWRPIGEDFPAPPHDAPVLLWSPPTMGHPDGWFEARPFSTGRSGPGWSEYSQHSWATRWMPLPTPPAAKEG